MTSIGQGAFDRCQALTSVTIPDSVTRIGDDAFLYCFRLDGVSLPDSVAELGEGVFDGCSSLTAMTIPEGITEVSAHMFQGCEKLTTVTLPDSVTSIGSGAFSYCTSLTEFTIPASVTNIGGTFLGCNQLAAIHVESGNPVYTDVDGVLFNKELTILVDFPDGKATEYTIPDGVTEIGSNVFYRCAGMTKVTIPDSVTEIGRDAFADCDALTIFGSEGSYAETFAAENGIAFEIAAVTEVSPLGDIDGSGNVLIAAAAIGASQDPHLTDAQKKAGDVNTDNSINATDAAIILQYAAAVGAGQKNVEITDFVRK